MTQRNTAAVIESLLTRSQADLERIAFDKDEPIIVKGTAYSLLKAARTGKFETLDKIISRVIGRSVEHVQVSGAAVSERATSFEEFCERAGYPMPYLRQVEMMRFGMEKTSPRLLLGSRGYGKTDYAVILGSAWKIMQDPTWTILLITKSDQKNAAILGEIAKALIANGVDLEKESASALRVAGLQGKDHSVAAVSLGSASLRGRHPRQVIMDDPVTEEDVSEAVRKRAERVYSEAMKLVSNVLIIGQPVHKFDLYESLRGTLEKLEMPHGTIPELDHDIEAMQLAGVSVESISASYHLQVISESGNPLEKIRRIDKFPPGSCVAFIDPSFEGGDFTAMSVIKSHFDGVAVFGKAWKRAWFDLTDEFQKVVSDKGVQKLCIETNSLGDQPVILLRDMLEGCGVVGRRTTGNKHSRIMAAGAFAHLIHLANDSDRAYIDQTIKYEYGAKNDDAPDSLASGLEWIGLIKGRSA